MSVDKQLRTAMFGLIIAGALFIAGCDSASSNNARSSEPPLLVISTDIATGLIDTHGAQSLLPVNFNNDATYSRDEDVSPQDNDDGLAVAMALNLDAQGVVDVLGIVPVYGNASLPAQMMVAQQIVWTLKSRFDLALEPGAIGPASQILQPSSYWYDNSVIPIEGASGSFAAACGNHGVDLMRDLVEDAVRPVTVLALGPMTDIACLLINFPQVSPNIKEIVVIGSRLENESLTINGIVVRDFNFSLDPIAGTLMLAEAANQGVQVRLMSFALTGQASQTNSLIEFNASTLTGPNPATVESEASLAWILAAIAPRNSYWSNIFGTAEGPFDQFAVVAAFQPELFDCRPAKAYVQQCPYPAWSSSYPTDSNGDAVDEPYNSPNNPCTDHGATHGSSLSQVPAELVANLDVGDQGAFVRGETGIDGNIPALNIPAVDVVACLDFTDSQSEETFAEILYDNTW